MPYAKIKAPDGGLRAKYPGFVKPALAPSIGRVPAGDRWVHEIKFEAIGCRSTSSTKPSRSARGMAPTGPIASRRSRPTLGGLKAGNCDGRELRWPLR